MLPATVAGQRRMLGWLAGSAPDPRRECRAWHAHGGTRAYGAALAGCDEYEHPGAARLAADRRAGRPGRGAAHGRDRVGTGGDPVLPGPGTAPVRLHPAGPVPVRPRL